MVRSKLHTKFLILIIGSMAVFLALLSYMVVRREAQLLAEKSSRQQHALADAVVTHLKMNMREGRPRETLALIQAIRTTPDVQRLEVLRSDGTHAFGEPGARSVSPYLLDALASGREVHFDETGIPPLQTIIIPLRNEQDCRSCHKSGGAVLGAVVISLSTEDTIREIVTAKRNLTVLLIAIILAVGGVLYVVVRRVVLTPLAVLREGAARIGSGDLGHRIPERRADELQDLAAAFNAMAGRLEESRGELERKIEERTEQVHAGMRQIRSTADRLYSYSRDMATISRLSTKVFNVDVSLDELLDRFMTGITRGLGYRQIMLCLVDRDRVWLDVRRDTGLGAALSFSGGSLLGDDPIVSLVRSAKLEILDADTLAPARVAGRTASGEHNRDLLLIPIMNRTQTRQCWQITSCIKTECPAYQEQKVPCWLIENTLCGHPLVESCGNKLAYCMTCQVFPVIGALLIMPAGRTRPAGGRNLSVLRILAAEMAAALDNHRLHADNLRMVRGLLELHRVTASALADLSLTRALDVFSDSALKFAGLEACFFWILSPDGRDLARMAGGCTDGGETEGIFPLVLPADDGVIGRAFNTQTGFVIDYDVSRNDTTPLGRAAKTSGLNSILVVPLKDVGGALGVLTVHKRSPLPFPENEIASHMLLANQAAMAVNVCLLSEKLKARNVRLAQQTGLMSGILSSMSSGVLLIDPIGTVVIINQAGSDILHARREDLLNRQLPQLFPETAVFLTAEREKHHEIGIAAPDGTTVPVGFSTAYYRDPAGETEGTLVVFRDLSEIKKLQAELLDKERFAAMGRVVAGVAHEVRNPLFGISSVGQILERELQDESHRELVRALLAETRRMNQLVEELLLYGRPMQLRLEHWNVTKLWDEVLSMHRAELERRGIRLVADPLAGNVTASLDANQMRQVFLNLLRNAIDATRAGGEISVRLLLAGRFVTFTLSDTGVGIPAENLDKIFDLFFTTKPKGTGLGLAICRKIVQDHGGDISVESTPGKGTSVTLRLPYQNRQQRAELNRTVL